MGSRNWFFQSSSATAAWYGYLSRTGRPQSLCGRIASTRWSGTRCSAKCRRLRHPWKTKLAGRSRNSRYPRGGLTSLSRVS